ncbi:MAG: hypothetical protein H6718_16490 [Polyangiaceae bacterium]|nr:hypothetical protein [Myxococcales bacterium]MCB9586999.1 hypothetical protein [Polyangiaceae bacterium]
MGNVDERTDLNSHTPFGTAVMRRPDIAGGVPSGPDTTKMAQPITEDLERTAASPGFEPVAAKRRAASQLALAATEPAGPSPIGLDSTLQSRTDSKAAAEQLRARFPQVDVVSTGNELNEAAGKGVRWVDSDVAPTIEQTEIAGAPAPTPAAWEVPPPNFQPPMPPLGSPASKAGLHWGIWVVLLVVVLGMLAAVVVAVLYGAL